MGRLSGGKKPHYKQQVQPKPHSLLYVSSQKYCHSSLKLQTGERKLVTKNEGKEWHQLLCSSTSSLALICSLHAGSTALTSYLGSHKILVFASVSAWYGVSTQPWVLNLQSYWGTALWGPAWIVPWTLCSLHSSLNPLFSSCDYNLKCNCSNQSQIYF